MSGTTIITPNVIDTTLLQDGQTGTITAADIRQMDDSISGLPVGSTQTTNYTFITTDRGCLIQYNSNTSPGTFTVPANIFQTYSLVGFRAIGSGQLTIAQGSGFTLSVPASLTLTPARYETGFIHFLSATTGVLM